MQRSSAECVAPTIYDAHPFPHTHSLQQPSIAIAPLYIPQISTLRQMAGGTIAPVQLDYTSKSPDNPLKC
jgi:hypothetical protein